MFPLALALIYMQRDPIDTCLLLFPALLTGLNSRCDLSDRSSILLAGTGSWRIGARGTAAGSFLTCLTRNWEQIKRAWLAQNTDFIDLGMGHFSPLPGVPSNTAEGRSLPRLAGAEGLPEFVARWRRNREIIGPLKALESSPATGAPLLADRFRQ